MFVIAAHHTVLATKVPVAECAQGQDVCDNSYVVSGSRNACADKCRFGAGGGIEEVTAAQMPVYPRTECARERRNQ